MVTEVRGFTRYKAAIVFALQMVCLSGLPAFAQVAENRIALVIGNGAYQHVDGRPALAQGAVEMAGALEAAGFEVFRSIDQPLHQLSGTVDAFEAALYGADIAILYYIGFGIQVRSDNYIVPVDASLMEEGDLERQTLRVLPIVEVMEALVPVNLVFLDASRPNPMAQRYADSLGMRSPLVGEGLAEIEPGVGTYLAYAGPPNVQVPDAADGTSRFTAALVEQMREPELELRSLMNRVREHVYLETEGRQLPWESSSLFGEVYFAEGDRERPAVEPPSDAEDEPEALAVERQFWQVAEAGGTEAAYAAYLDAYPNGTFAGLASERLEAIAVARREADQRQREEEATARSDEIPAVALQWALRALGHYTSRVDGSIGPVTRAAIRAFQQTIGTEPSGELTAEERVRLIQMAAEQGQAESQNTLGIMFASGIGVPEDIDAARRWFQASADQGFAPASANLDRLRQ